MTDTTPAEGYTRMSDERFMALVDDEENWEDDPDLCYELFDALQAERAEAKSLRERVEVLESKLEETDPCTHRMKDGCEVLTIAKSQKRVVEAAQALAATPDDVSLDDQEDEWEELLEALAALKATQTEEG